MKTNKEQETLSLYTPNVLIKIGVSLNIIFAAILSLLYFTLIFTIPIIALNIYILVPRTQIKRYYGMARLITVILSALLTLIVLLVVIFVSSGVIDIYNGVAKLVNFVVFWNDRTVMAFVTPDVETVGLKTFEIIFTIIGFAGPILTSIGWYNKKELSTVEEPVEKNKEKEKSKNDRKNK